MMRSWWAKVTGSDRKQAVPQQQGSSLGRVGNLIVVFPYGHYADLPNNSWLRVISPGVAIPVTTDRPSDLASGEPAFFHPQTNSRIIARNNGDLDMIPTSGVVNVIGEMLVTGEITANFGGSSVTLSGHTHGQGSDSNGDSEVDVDPPTAGT